LDCSFVVAEERITQGNYDSVAKVGDFGLSVVMNGLSSLRREKQANFDAHYATPEQLKGQHYTTSSDVFAFGSILWELTRRKKVFHDVCLLFSIRFLSLLFVISQYC
jgi:serine/threonine protein kinase